METWEVGSPGKTVFVLVVASIVILAGIITVYHSPSTTNSSMSTTGTFNQQYVSGPISTFPASWTDACGYLVQGTETTTNGVDHNGYGLSINLNQVYSKIVTSSVFQTLAAGRTWVTLDWGVGQQGNIGDLQTFVVGGFLFISGGIPDADGYAQIDYFVPGGNVTVVSSGPFMGTCVPDIAFRDGASLLGNGTYAVGQPVGINFTFRNLTNASMTITARTTCLANFTVIQGGIANSPNGPQWPSGPVVYDSAKHAGCTGPPLKVVLNPGKGYAQTVEWDQTSDNGTQVPPGEYQIIGIEAGDLGQLFPVQVGEVIVGHLTEAEMEAEGDIVTSRSIVSVVQSPTQQNITITVGVRSFASPLTLFFDTGPSSFDTVRVFQGKPAMFPTPGDVCDWYENETGPAGAPSPAGQMSEVPIESVPGITVNAPTIQMQPFSNATFKFSMEIQNPPPGYYITFLGFVIQLHNGQKTSSGTVDLATFFPINPPFGQLDENITGTCPIN